ncbi:MAG: AAA family ATPase, partial [Bacteroidales bacterium]|nr:AAA family ATPase [Bacteroidales bacterium]
GIRKASAPPPQKNRRDRADLRAREDDFYGKLNTGAKHLGNAARLTEEYQAASLLDGAISNAVYAALKIQEACNITKEFSLRIGIHQGEVVFENGDIFGDTVNIASRLQSLAPPAGIFVSASVHHNISNKNDIRSEFVGVENLKNVREPISVYRILAEGDEVTATGEQNPAFSSIIPGFEHDIYISYRSNDNKYDAWVSEFAAKLERELSATLKDKVSIWFDKNPEDKRKAVVGMGNVKSLIFIPIVSQTYCDPESPVWQGEFKGFNEGSKTDSIGSSVKLLNGNAASRVIPVKIHDVETEDIRLLESALSGGLRSVDFIYREDGVNRPLRPVDDEKSGDPMRALYRNQINKLANAIKDIIQAIKQKGKTQAETIPDQQPMARQIVPNVFATSISAAIKVQVIDRQRPSIYLAWTSNDLKESREEMAIIGETPNIAARLQTLAKPGTVVIGPNTHRLVEGMFICNDLGPRHLKGISEPVRVYRVRAESGVRNRFEVRVTRGLIPLVGRDEEINILLKRWEQAQDGEGQVVLLSGEAGIGKSRILKGFQEQLGSERRNQVLYYCSPYQRNSPFYPVIDQLERILNFRKNDSMEQKLDKLGNLLGDLGLPVTNYVPVLLPYRATARYAFWETGINIDNNDRSYCYAGLSEKIQS